MKLHAWFDMLNLEHDRQINQTQSTEQKTLNFNQDHIKESIQIVSNLIDEEAKLLGSYSKVLIGGFSQGCALALATFLLKEY